MKTNQKLNYRRGHKSIMFFLLANCIAFSTLAQKDKSDFRNELSFGLKIGANYSNVYNSSGEKFVADPKFGVAAGAFLTLPIGKYIGIQPEILFSQKGFKATGVLLGSTYEVSRTTSYIDLPIFLAIKPIESITILAGPQFSYLLNQKDEYTNGKTTTQQQQQFNNDNLRKNTVCFVAGIDINIKATVIGLRAGWDVLNNNGDGTSTTPQYKNAWLQGTVGFRL